MISTTQANSVTKQPSQTSIHFPSYIHLHQFTFISSDSNSTNQINYDEGYTVTLRTSNINDRIIQASIIESTHFRRKKRLSSNMLIPSSNLSLIMIPILVNHSLSLIVYYRTMMIQIIIHSVILSFINLVM